MPIPGSEWSRLDSELNSLGVRLLLVSRLGKIEWFEQGPLDSTSLRSTQFKKLKSSFFYFLYLFSFIKRNTEQKLLNMCAFFYGRTRMKIVDWSLQSKVDFFYIYFFFKSTIQYRTIETQPIHEISKNNFISTFRQNNFRFNLLHVKWKLSFSIEGRFFLFLIFI